MDAWASERQAEWKCRRADSAHERPNKNTNGDDLRGPTAHHKSCESRQRRTRSVQQAPAASGDPASAQNTVLKLYRRDRATPGLEARRVRSNKSGQGMRRSLLCQNSVVAFFYFPRTLSSTGTHLRYGIEDLPADSSIQSHPLHRTRVYLVVCTRHAAVPSRRKARRPLEEGDSACSQRGRSSGCLSPPRTLCCLSVLKLPNELVLASPRRQHTRRGGLQAPWRAPGHILLRAVQARFPGALPKLTFNGETFGALAALGIACLCSS
ncbi:hypothetical protein C8R45DRAFT_936549 [Mycena sanguinolenta]|nr:hypothetical protein C8R45DRAFT_936549 [Mycena sanguinolenta]